MGQIAFSLPRWYAAIELDGLLENFAGMRIVPSDDSLVLSGDISFKAQGPDGVEIADTYTIKIEVPFSFPETIPSVWETSKRIPRNFHKLTSNRLCLAAPTQLRLGVRKSSSLLQFVKQFVVPYLFGYSYFEQFDRMPFGELSHGNEGIRDYLREMYSAGNARNPEEFLRLSSLHKRVANKRPCPCGSRRRLGRCHNRVVNAYRRELGRKWFAKEYHRVTSSLDDEC